MVAEIGIVIGLYVMTRMIELMVGPKERRNVFLIVCALVTLLITALSTFDLLVRGLQGTGTPRVPGL
jgi:hypothetical protein